ncbi:MAG: tetratricopeptide repeat protein [Gammaproteobacteria bacterium]|nr:tetratricopeptide repeat protein [Gammaproteobacteria bacterium]
MRRIVLSAALGLFLTGVAAQQTLAPDARSLLEAGRFADAEAAARAMTMASPDAPEAWQILAEALAAVGRMEEALEAYRRIPQGANGPRLDVQMAMARIERLYGLGDRWEERMNRVLAGYRARRDTLPAAEIRAAGDAAWQLAREDPARYADALQIYEHAIRRDPDDPSSHVAIGDLLLDRYNNEEALEAYRTALEKNKDFVPALLGVARSQHFDHSDGALDTVRHVLKKQPNHTGAILLLARLNLELEDYEEAETLIDRALSVNPRFPAALSLAAAIAFLRGDDVAFDVHNARLREQAPGYTTHFETLAEVAAQNRLYERAEEFALRAIVLNPNAWRGHALLGINRLRLGKMHAGRESLETAFRGDPFDPRTKNALELLDLLDGYAKFRSARFVLTAHPREMEVLAPRVIEIAEQAYDYFSGVYGYQPSTPMRIEFYRRHEDFSVRITGLVGVDILGVSFGPVVALDSPSAGVFGPVNFGATLWHELAHSFHMGLTESRVPRWFSEGLAVFEERRARPGWGFDVSPGFLTAFLQGRLAPASKLNQAFLRPSYPEQIVHGYFQGALLMELIHRDHGFEAILRMLEGYRDGGTTESLLREVLGLEPTALDAAFDAYVRERFGHALTALTPVTDPEAGVMPRGRYVHLLTEGREALQAGDDDRARTALSEAQALFPEHAGPDSAYASLATLYTREGKPELAIDQLERAIAIDADDLDAHRRLAELYTAAGDAGSAAATIDRALLIQPFDATLYQTLAGIRESRGEWRLAAAARAAVVALDPSDPAEARYLLARAHRRAGDLVAAKREVLGALELAPMYEQALELLLEVREASGT